MVRFYADAVGAPPVDSDIAPDLLEGTVVLDPTVEARVLSQGTAGTIWIYRYYDLRPRTLESYGSGLVRLIELIERSAARHTEQFRGVDIAAHSMGGLVTREGVLAMHRQEPGSAKRRIHRIVTLGTPHRGIAFQRAPDWLLRVLPKVNDAGDEMASFRPDSTRFLDCEEAFDTRRILTVVGTDYRSYNIADRAGRLARATTATIRRTLITIPARLARSARRITLHLPEAWPWQTAFDRLFTATHDPPPVTAN